MDKVSTEDTLRKELIEVMLEMEFAKLAQDKIKYEKLKRKTEEIKNKRKKIAIEKERGRLK